MNTNITHIAIDSAPDVRWVYQVSPAYAGSLADIRREGVICAARYQGVWQIGGIAVVRDARYREILDATPVFGGAK